MCGKLARREKYLHTLPGADQAALKALAVTRNVGTPAQTRMPTGTEEAASPDLAQMKLMMAKLQGLMDAMTQ